MQVSTQQFSTLKKQSVPHCEIHPAKRSSSANDRCRQASIAQKSEDPFDKALAFSERAAPPSPLQAGTPAWLTPGLLRSPLNHQVLRPANVRGARQSGLLRGRRSRPGQPHAGGPRSEGALGGAKHSKDARGRFGGGIGHSSTAQTLATPQKVSTRQSSTRQPHLHAAVAAHKS